MNKTTTLLTAAFAGLMIAANAQADKGHKAKDKAAGVECTEGNDCHTKGSCKGAHNECKGKNSCKGHTFHADSEEACTKAHGKVKKG